MKITFAVPAHLTPHWSDNDGSDDEDLPIPPELDGMRLTPDVIEPYLDEELLLAGIVGGEIWGATKSAHGIGDSLAQEQLEVHVVFWSPSELPPTLLEKLHENAAGQISDGIGSNGFDVVLGGKQRTVNFYYDAEVRLLSVVDDGRVIPPPSPIAVAVRQGDVAAARAAIRAFPEQVNVPLGGYAPLHTAILAGMVETVELLIAAGADVNVLAPLGETTLQLCAWVRDLNDEQCTHIARLLLAAGVNRDHRTELSGTALEGATSRERRKLAALLAGDAPRAGRQ